MTPFLVLSLPRSRSFWLSRFLSYGDYHCSHEQARHVRGIDDVRSWLSMDATGSCETSVARWWRLILHVRPDVRIVVVRRPVKDALASLMALDLSSVITLKKGLILQELRRIDRALDQIERLPGVLSVRFEDLEQEATCAAVFEHCLGCKHDHGWWANLSQINLQSDMKHLMRYMLANAPQLAVVQRDLARKLRSLLRDGPVLGVPDANGVTIQREPFDTFWRDGQHLMREHCMEVGEEPDSYKRKNIPFFRLLDQIGALHVFTARSNGRMFGYFISMLSPSLEEEGLVSERRLPFFVTTDAPQNWMLGMKLHRTALAASKRRGVGEVFYHEGVRGEGERAGAIYRRLGAQPLGQIYRLDLRAA